MNSQGQQLENFEASFEFKRASVVNSSVGGTLKSFSNLTKNIAPVIVFGSISIIITSSVIGFSIQSLVKIFIIIEFSALLQLFNVQFDQLLEHFLLGVYNLANIDILNFVTEDVMQRDVSNSVAS